MSKKRNYSNIKKDNPSKKEEKLSARKIAQQIQKKKQMQQIIIGGAIALLVIVAITLALLSYYGDNVVARINGTPIRASEIAPHLGTADRQLRDRGADLWSQNFEQDVREEAVRIAALPSMYEDFGRSIGLSFEDGESSATITHSVTEAIINDAALFADFERFMPEGQSLAEIESEAMIAQMLVQTVFDQSLVIMERALAGEDFAELMHTYSEDGGLADFPNGYTFVAGQMVEEFYEATKALEIGEVSMPIQSQFGFHVIMRIEPNADDMMSPVDVPEEELLGAMHILLMVERAPTLEDVQTQYNATVMSRMRHAVAVGFNEKLDDANLVFRSVLRRVDI